MTDLLDTMPAITVPNFGTDAACITADPTLFFPGKGENGKAKQARDYCNNCPVQETCLMWAVDENIRYGMWGGLTTEQRDEIRARTGRKTAGVGAAERNKAEASDRRRQIVALTNAGHTAAEIADQLRLSPRTIGVHRRIARHEGLL